MHREDLEKVFSRIEPDDALKNRIMDRIEENEMKKSTLKKTMRISAAAACVAIIGITTAFAAGNIVDNMISYFQSDKAVDITSMAALAEYNEEVGVTASNGGYTLTIDNLATDDNFMHVFYTVKKDDAAISDEDNYNLWFIYRVNGKVVNFGNHNEEYAYQTEDGGYKGVKKLNIADMDVPETFTLEMYSEAAITEEGSFEGDYLYKDDVTFTDADKAKLLYVSTTAKKSSVETKSLVKDVNKKFPITYFDDATGQMKDDEGEISKVVFSPFGSQLVVKDKCQGFGGMKLSSYAMFDENGQSLDILNISFNSAGGGEESTNKLEFLKADANTKSLKIVPLKNYEYSKMNTQSIGTYPLTYKAADCGNVVVTDIRFSDGVIEIDYYKDGFVLYDPYFKITDDNGNNVEPGGKLGCLLTTIVHHDTNSYTAKYSYCGEYDENGQKVPFDLSTVSKENLEKSFTRLGVGEYKVTLDFDDAIDIDLK